MRFRARSPRFEQGRRTIPFAGIYAWADVLGVPRDALFRFVAGESEQPPAGALAALSIEETMLVELFRKLTPAEQRAIRDRVHALVARHGLRAKRSK